MPILQSHKPGSFCWFELGTKDQNAAKQFYQSLFGWSVTDFPLTGDEVYSMFQLEGHDAAAAYTLHKDMLANGVPTHWMPYVCVTDVDQSTAKAKSLGGKVLVEPLSVMDFGRMAVVQDPTGAQISLWQPKNHIGTEIGGVDGTVCWADLVSSDPAKAADFYRALFDWEIAASERDSSGYLHIKNGADFIGGIPPARPGAPPQWLLYFQVSNCDATTAKAQQSGATVYVPPTTMEGVGRFSVIADPQGGAFAAFQDKSTL